MKQTLIGFGLSVVVTLVMLAGAYACDSQAELDRQGVLIDGMHEDIDDISNEIVQLRQRFDRLIDHLQLERTR